MKEIITVSFDVEEIKRINQEAINALTLLDEAISKAIKIDTHGSRKL